MSNELGALRRSAVVMTFAPGAVVDFRAGGAPVSAVVAGLEEWDANAPPAGLANPQVIYEPRLQRKLRVAGFRLPPVALESTGHHQPPDPTTLVAVRFPMWLQCPQCDEIALAGQWGEEPGKAFRYCGKCTHDQPGGRKIMVVPVRFVLACSAGHLEEFPWHRWVRHKPECPSANKPAARLRLRSEGAGLAGLILSCPKCRARRSMEGVFRKEAMREFRCQARRPWLGGVKDPNACAARPGEPEPELRAVQRGASNLYFPAVESAISIPPWADELQASLGQYWDPIVGIEDPAQRRLFINVLSGGATAVLADVLRHLRLTADGLAEMIEARVNAMNATEGEDLRLEEYRRLSGGLDATQSEFEIRRATVPAPLVADLARLVRVTRLREVRALYGFTRIYPPSGDAGAVIAPLYSGPRPSWLPAIEVRGEGIFLALRADRLAAWESAPAVTSRIDGLRDTYLADWNARYPGRRPPVEITPRLVLLHTLAHALMRELTLECGYSTAALRERLYVSPGADGMAGILIYTATADSDGTLGGLERQGLPERFGSVFLNAIRTLEWCSSDPLCIESAMGGAEALSLAACHACCLAPETSCEHYNRFLDRALLVGLPTSPQVGFFRSLLEHDHGSDVASAPATGRPE